MTAHSRRKGARGIVELPYPPTANTYYRKMRNVMVLSERGREFRVAVAVECLKHRLPTLTGRVAVRIAVHPPDARKRDIDNVIKPTLDALAKAGAFENDEQVDDLHVMRGETVEGGCACVQVWQIEGERALVAHLDGDEGKEKT